VHVDRLQHHPTDNSAKPHKVNKIIILSNNMTNSVIKGQAAAWNGSMLNSALHHSCQPTDRWIEKHMNYHLVFAQQSASILGKYGEDSADNPSL